MIVYTLKEKNKRVDDVKREKPYNINNRRKNEIYGKEKLLLNYNSIIKQTAATYDDDEERKCRKKLI